MTAPLPSRYRLVWARPRVTVYTAADRRPVSFTWNRYPGVVIGFAVQVGTKVASLTWGRPGEAVPLGRHRVR